MTCTEISTLTPLFLSGELDAVRGPEFREHLNLCDSCAREVREQESIDSRLRRFLSDEKHDTAFIEQQVRASIKAESRRRLLAVVAIAAVVLFAVVGYQMLLGARTKAIYRAAAADHMREIVEQQPRTWQTDLTAIERLAGTQGIETAEIASISLTGYRLAQGRLCLLNGRVFLHLVYTDGRGNVSVFLRSKDTPKFRTGDAGAFGNEYVAGIRKTSLTALVVSNQSEMVATHLAQSLL